MSITDKLRSRFGSHMQESLGVRTASPPPVPRDGRPPAASPDDGRTRAREAGYMEIDRLIPDPDQPRKYFDEESIARLAESLQRYGQLQPLRCRWNEAIGKWVLIAGERRYRAAVLAGFKTVACLFVDGDLSPTDILEEQLIENLQRQDLKPVETAAAYRQLMTSHGWSARELSAELSISEAGISKALALLALPADIQDQVNTGLLPATAAYQVARLETDEERREVVDRIVNEKLTRDQAEAVVQRRATKSKGRGGKGKPRKITSHTIRTSPGPRVIVEWSRGLDEATIRAALVDALAVLDSGTSREVAA